MGKIGYIYQITNLVNGKIYIGSTWNSINRYRSHKSLLEKNKHHSIHLQSS